MLLCEMEMGLFSVVDWEPWLHRGSGDLSQPPHRKLLKHLVSLDKAIHLCGSWLLPVYNSSWEIQQIV